jgi:YVTN family beta-propeller protein
LESNVQAKLKKPSRAKMHSTLGVITMVLLLSSSLVVVSSFLSHGFFHFSIAYAHSATIPLGIAPYGIKYNPSTDSIYVANAVSSTVSVINGSSNSVIDTILVGRGPMWLEYVPSNNQIYVTNYLSNDVYVINSLTNDVVKAIPVGGSPWGIAYDPINNSIYVGNTQDGTVSVINATTDAVVSTIPLLGFRDSTLTTVSSLHYSIAYSSINDALYVYLDILLAMFQ